jgi:hypothetical protein
MSRWRTVLLGFLLITACSDGPTTPSRRARTYMMGFSNIPPSPDQAVALATLNLWAERADAAIMHVGVPWAAMLADTTAAAKVAAEMVPVANYYRAHGFQLVVTVDVTDGLDRSAEAPELIALGRSITDTAIQRLYREFVSAVDTILRPEYLGLAAETNLIRVAAPDSVYRAVVTLANAAAAEQRGLGTTAHLYVSVQVEVAWGRLQATNVYLGVDQDRTDFPFVDALGLSSYPYLGGFADPDQVPLDYYARIDAGNPIPLLIVEGGWASQSAGGFTTSPATQARWIHHEAELLDSARAVAVFQLSFADLALGLFPPQPPGSILPLFATLGLVDTVLTPKPSLAAWDSIFARPLRPRP